MQGVLILGGYGNFGKRIARSLAKSNISISISGRDPLQAKHAAEEIKAEFPICEVSSAAFDVNQQFSRFCEQLKPLIVINTCGPFQTSDYRVAEICIAQKVHYIDLADGRDFVKEITTLNTAAEQSGVLVVSGASTVPGLASAVLEHYQGEFSVIESLKYGISPGQKAPRGLATTQAILTYLGKPLKPYPHPGNNRTHYGWQDLYCQSYPELGNRWMANCEVPDLSLFPTRYGIKSIQFSAGMESTLLHFSMVAVSWLVRLGLPVDLPKHAQFLLNLSHYFDIFGTANGGMHMILQGKDRQQQPKTTKWYIIAKEGDGPQIPCVPAIVLTKKLIAEKISTRGAMACVGLITLQEYLDELKDFNIKEVVL